MRFFCLRSPQFVFSPSFWQKSLSCLEMSRGHGRDFLCEISRIFHPRKAGYGQTFSILSWRSRGLDKISCHWENRGQKIRFSLSPDFHSLWKEIFFYKGFLHLVLKRAEDKGNYFNIFAHKRSKSFHVVERTENITGLFSLFSRVHATL